MKNRYLGSLLVCFALFSCTPDAPVEPDKPTPPPPTPEEPSEYITETEGVEALWHSRFADDISFKTADDVLKVKWMLDGKPSLSYRKSLRKASSDLRYEFVGADCMRFVSESDGYAVTLPLDLGLVPDYTLAKYAQRFEGDGISLRITMERVNPYPATKEYYDIYTGEWLDRYISNSNYISQNGLKFLESVVKDDESLLEGYSVNLSSIYAQGLDLPYYKIALVRPVGQWSKFGFLVYKCRDRSALRQFDHILKTFKVITNFGTSKNYVEPQKARPNPKWNARTAAYYDKLLAQKTFDFGVFSYSMPGDNEPENVASTREKLRAETSRLEAVFGRPFDIMPTYSHIAWYSSKMEFPSTLAGEFAGGDGFNSKPVLQFTYQFTTNNNNVSSYNSTQCQTPMFDILRGVYDEDFRKLASAIKAYGYPVLFRLNNEMNTDWTSYCGMMTLCDPEIFILTWRYLYDIFESEGVDNCIWIFNPNAVSCPYSRWGEDLAYYPGDAYVQALGVTNYEMGNNVPFESFRDRYNLVYNTNKELFSQMPWIISEFACGSGGATTGVEMRNGHYQAEWVRGMFQDFLNYDSNPYLHPLKGGVWFNCNDYAGEQTTNFLRLDPALTETLDAFRWGFKEMYKN